MLRTLATAAEMQGRFQNLPNVIECCVMIEDMLAAETARADHLAACWASTCHIIRYGPDVLSRIFALLRATVIIATLNLYMHMSQ